MNLVTGDALLTSIWDTDNIRGNGTVYGADIALGAAARFLEGRLKIRFRASTAFTGSGNLEIALYSGSTANPTTKVRTVWLGLKTAMTAGKTVDVVLGTHELDKYVRIGVINTGASSTGAGKADIVPIAS